MTDTERDDDDHGVEWSRRPPVSADIVDGSIESGYCVTLSIHQGKYEIVEWYRHRLPNYWYVGRSNKRIQLSWEGLQRIRQRIDEFERVHTS